jgi:hypothetical protein
MNIIMKPFAWRRVDRAQTLKHRLCVCGWTRSALGCTRATSARLYKIDHLSVSVMARSIAVEEGGRVVMVAS